jgi:hypothetical protein
MPLNKLCQNRVFGDFKCSSGAKCQKHIFAEFGTEFGIIIEC